MIKHTIERTVLTLALITLSACKAGLPPAPAGADPADAANAPAAWTAPPSPFESSAFDAAELGTKEPHSGHKGHRMPETKPKPESEPSHTGQEGDAS